MEDLTKTIRTVRGKLKDMRQEAIKRETLLVYLRPRGFLPRQAGCD